MKEYIEKSKIVRMAKSCMPSCPSEEMDVFATRIENHKPAAVYSIFPGVKIGMISGMDDDISVLKYDEETVVSVYRHGDSILVRTDCENEYTYEEIMENTDIVRTNDCKVLTDEPFLTTANLARHVRELIMIWNETNVPVSKEVSGE